MFPAVAFAVAFLFWILINPPAGPRVPMMVGILALVLVRTQFNPAPLVIAMVLNLFIAVAPVYWLIMPAISTSVGLLGLVFVYSLFFGCLGGINPVFKLAPLVMFVSVAGISNQQSYSFQGPVDAALMWVIAGTLVAIIYPFFAALRKIYTLQ